MPPRCSRGPSTVTRPRTRKSSRAAAKARRTPRISTCKRETGARRRQLQSGLESHTVCGALPGMATTCPHDHSKQWCRKHTRLLSIHDHTCLGWTLCRSVLRYRELVRITFPGIPTARAVKKQIARRRAGAAIVETGKPQTMPREASRYQAICAAESNLGAPWRLVQRTCLESPDKIAKGSAESVSTTEYLCRSSSSTNSAGSSVPACRPGLNAQGRRGRAG